MRDVLILIGTIVFFAGLAAYFVSTAGILSRSGDIDEPQEPTRGRR